MKSAILNTPECGVAPGYDCGEADRVESDLAVDDKRGASGGTIYIPASANEAVGAVYMEISTSVSGTGTVSIRREGSAILVQSAGSNFLVLIGAQNNGSVGPVLFEGPAFHPAFQPAA